MQMSCSPHSGLPWGLRRESLINAGLREEKKGDSLPVPCSQWSPRTNLLFSLKLQATGGGGCPPCSERCSQLSPQEKLEAATGREDQGTEGVLQCCTLGLETFPPLLWGFPMAQEVKDPPARQGATGDLGSTPGLGRPPGGGNGNPVQCSCLENPMGRGAWWATVRRVTDSDMPEHRAHRHGEPAMVEQGAVRTRKCLPGHTENRRSTGPLQPHGRAQRPPTAPPSSSLTSTPLGLTWSNPESSSRQSASSACSYPSSNGWLRQNKRLGWDWPRVFLSWENHVFLLR